VKELVASRCLVNVVVGSGLGSGVQGSRFGNRDGEEEEEEVVTGAEEGEGGSWRVWGGHGPRSSDLLWGSKAWRFRDSAYRARYISL
jgi:hypothetical protein